MLYCFMNGRKILPSLKYQKVSKNTQIWFWIGLLPLFLVNLRVRSVSNRKQSKLWHWKGSRKSFVLICQQLPTDPKKMVILLPKRGPKCLDTTRRKAMERIWWWNFISAKLEITGAYLLVSRMSNHRKTWLDIFMTIIIN